MLDKCTKTKNKFGFTLVETLVAISLLLVAIIGPMSIAAQGLQASFFAREQATAVYLAQEAVESIQKLRDEDALGAVYGGDSNPWNWYDDIDLSCKDGTGCDYDIINETYVPCDTETACVLLFDLNLGAGNYYQYVNGNLSNFTRTIWLSESPTNEVLVTVEVSWIATLFSGQTSSVVLQTRIFNQYE